VQNTLSNFFAKRFIGGFGPPAPPSSKAGSAVPTLANLAVADPVAALMNRDRNHRKGDRRAIPIIRSNIQRLGPTISAALRRARR
jgi:hypothetical protein